MSVTCSSSKHSRPVFAAIPAVVSLLAPPALAGVRYVAFFQASHAETPKAKAFVSAFIKKYGVMPEQRSALAYDATILIGHAALEGGATRGRVRDYLASIGSARDAADGVTGRIAFDQQHDVVDKPVVIATVGK